MAEIVGYARVSSTGQDLTTQLEKLGGGGCLPENIFKEKRSGTDRGRPELQRCLGYVRKGDTLLVSKLDRLARSTVDLYIVAQLQAKGVEFTKEPTTIRPGVRICFIRGPQGISVELLERDKKYA